MRTAYDALIPGGSVITSNMDDHGWIRFCMEEIGAWKLNYKDLETMEGIMSDAGFIDSEVYKIPEGYHWIALGKKPNPQA